MSHRHDDYEPHSKRPWKLWAAVAAGAIFAVFIGLIWLADKAKAGVVCNTELSVGMGASDDQLKNAAVPGSKVDLSQAGVLGGIGAGCDLQTKTAVLGVFARYSLMHVVGDVGGGASIKADRLWEIAARAGVRWHDKYTFYGLAGWAGMNLDLPAGFDSKSPNGLLLGAGVDAHLTGPWYARAEYDWHHFRSEGLGGGDRLQPDLHTVRAALVFKFGEDRKNIFTDEVDPPAPKQRSVK